ncbi:MAG: dTDP-4-dehydrorhamnose reductase [Saprospiraceae bacterium]
MKKTPVILVTGANGQLGRCFQKLASRFPHWQFVFADREQLDVTDRSAVFAFFEKKRPTWCLNGAAYTAVDKAENEPIQARRVNFFGAKNIAEACARLGIPTIHISTDYVYHGRQNTPLREDAPVSPKSVYARTKLAGDRAVLRHNPLLGMVIRTSWLYAPHGHNFARTMLRLGAERPALNVVFDQVGTPTYAPDLAEAVLKIVEKVENGDVPESALAGIWHYSNEGVGSWYDFAQAIVDLSGLPCKVNAIETKDYPLPAPRPPFSVLDKRKIKAVFVLDVPHWRRGVERFLQDIG